MDSTHSSQNDTEEAIKWFKDILDANGANTPMKVICRICGIALENIPHPCSGQRDVDDNDDDFDEDDLNEAHNSQDDSRITIAARNEERNRANANFVELLNKAEQLVPCSPSYIRPKHFNKNKKMERIVAYLEQNSLNEAVETDSTSKDKIYATKVAEYIRSVKNGEHYTALVECFTDAAKKQNDMSVDGLWQVVSCMANIGEMPRTEDPLKIRNTKYAFVVNAKEFLEHRYKLFMQTYISDRLSGAEPDTMSDFELVSSYVALNFNNQTGNTIGLQDAHIDGKLLWPMVYYSLRCGSIQSALECLKQPGAFQNSVGHDDLIQVLEEKFRKPNQRISAKLDVPFEAKEKKSIRKKIDGYKFSVNGIIGCCDVPAHSNVAKTADDFLWIQLSMIQPDDNGNMSVNDDNIGSDSSTYSGLQSMNLEKRLEKYFKANEQPHLYFQVLVLTGQFEAAIEFLFRFDRYRTHAVHIALALNEMFLLGLSRSVQQPLLSIDDEDPIPLRRLNIARLIMLYVRNFEITDPAEALQYFYFLRDEYDSEERNLFLTCVANFTAENREKESLFNSLFGRIVEGRSSFALIENFKIEMDTWEACEIVADELVKKGLFEDAVKLYDLAGIEEQCLRYLSILLSPVVHKKKGSLRDRLYTKAVEFSKRYADTELHCNENIRDTFSTLLDLMEFFDLYHEREYDLALITLDKSTLVPLDEEQLEERVNNFKRLGGEVSKVFPDLLLATMDIIHTRYNDAPKHEEKWVGRFRDEYLTILRKQANAIVTFAKNFRIPNRISSRLVQTEILMH